MKTIILIYQAHYPWDVRIEKFLKALSDKYVVHLLTRNRKSSKKIERINDRIFIHRLGFEKNRKFDFLTTPIHLNPLWRIFLQRKIKQLRPSLIIVRDLPLAKLAIRKGMRFNIPVIFDNAENYPEFINTFPKYKNVLYKTLNGFKYFTKLEKYAVKHSSSTINVIEENTVRLRAIYNNTNYLEIYNVPISDGIIEPSPTDYLQQINICYAGAVSDDNLRGVSDLIRASEYINYPHKIHVFGDGNEKVNLELLAKSNPKIKNNIIFHGSIEYSNLKSILINMDIGVVPHRKNKMTDTTMANKIYEYISYGMCIVSSNAIPLKRFTMDNKIGLVYDSGDYYDLAKKINEAYMLNLLKYEERLYRYRLFKNTYNWDVEKTKLLSLVNNHLSTMEGKV